jgi:hypothetical protein
MTTTQHMVEQQLMVALGQLTNDTTGSELVENVKTILTGLIQDMGTKQELVASRIHTALSWLTADGTLTSAAVDEAVATLRRLLDESLAEVSFHEEYVWTGAEGEQAVRSLFTQHGGDQALVNMGMITTWCAAINLEHPPVGQLKSAMDMMIGWVAYLDEYDDSNLISSDVVKSALSVFEYMNGFVARREGTPSTPLATTS